MVAWGEAARVEVGVGTERFARSAERLRILFESIEVTEAPSGLPGGPIAFGSFSFDPERSGSLLVIPRVVVTSRDGITSCTAIGEMNGLDKTKEGVDLHDFKIRYAGSSVSEIGWLDSVSRAREAVAEGDLEKVVLARDLKIWSKTPFDIRVLLRRLATRFPECFTFSNGGLVGATPELLIRRSGPQIESLVLAGSARRGDSDEEDRKLGAELLASPKERVEHEPAVRSVQDTLSSLGAVITVPEEPGLLKLQNVQHLATHIEGRLEGPSALEIAGALHPTAAVCGLPRAKAMGLIRASEGLDRGRYAGPVGWVSPNGDGEWGIALRCAELDGTRGRLFAGAGIVADSVPEDELEETRLKLRAMTSALESA
jgi:menaquinone-specific isochorismate synthase